MENPFEIIEKYLIQVDERLARIEKQNSIATTETYFRLAAAADFLSSTSGALGVMVHRGIIPYIKKMGKLYFRKPDLIDWLEKGS